MGNKEEKEVCATVCVQIENLSKRVDQMDVRLNIFNDSLNVLDKKATAMGERDTFFEKLLGRLEEAFKSNTLAIASVEKTMGTIEKTMVSMQNDINNNANTTKRIEDKLGRLENKFDEAEEKSKIDLRDILKQVIENKLVQILGALVSIGLFVWLITNANWGKISVLFTK